MQAARIVFGLAFFVGAVALLAHMPDTRDRREDVHALSAMLMGVAGVAVWMWPWRKSLPALGCLVFVYFSGRYLIQEPGAIAAVLHVTVLVVAGMFLRGLFRITPDDVARDLASASGADRARGLTRLGFLLREEYGIQRRRAQALLAAAAEEGDDEMRAAALTLAEELGLRPGMAKPPTDATGDEDEASDEDHDAHDDEAHAEAADGPEDDAGVPPPLPSALAPEEPGFMEVDGPPPLPSVETLVETLRGGEPGPCRKAIAQLVEIGEPAIPALEAAAEEGDADLRIDALEALRQIRGELPT